MSFMKMEPLKAECLQQEFEQLRLQVSCSSAWQPLTLASLADASTDENGIAAKQLRGSRTSSRTRQELDVSTKANSKKRSAVVMANGDGTLTEDVTEDDTDEEEGKF